MALENYARKRRFEKTPEPKPITKIVKTKPIKTGRFVVQKHQASHLHYDFRLELPANFEKGELVLKSWAVPKGVPQKLGIKHLAVAVEDHPIGYLNFSGIIPKGNYGAGKVEIFDQGKFKIISLNKKSLKFQLLGQKLKGDYVLAQFGENQKNWLIFKIT